MKPTKEKTMEAIYLQSMTNFVLERFKFWQNDDNPDCQSSARYILGTNAYAKFLIQPLQLGMFVPCDENGNVLEEPKRWNDYLQFPDSFDGNKEWGELYNYELAIERILFKGLYWEGNYVIGNMPDEMIYVDEEFCQDMTIEDFFNTIISKIELTPTAIKQIGL